MPEDSRREPSEAEKAAIESEARLRFALKSCNIGTWDLKLGGDQTIATSAEHDRIFGYDQPQERWTLEDFFRHALPEYRRPVREMVRKAAEEKTGCTSECRIRRTDGQVRWIWFSGRYFVDEAGTPHVAGLVQDITEHKEIEEALRQSQSRYHSLFANNHAAMLLMDPQKGHIVDANPAACRFYGYSRDELTCMRIDQINTLAPEQVRERMEEARREKNYSFRFCHRLASGEMRDVQVYSGPIYVDGRQLLYSIIHDVTEQTSAEEALRKSRLQQARHNEFLQTLLDNADVCIAVLQGRDLRFTLVNRACRELVPDRDMVGRTLGEVIPGAVASGGDKILREVMETGQPREDHAFPVAVPGKPDAVWDHRVVRLPDRDGQEPSVLLITWDVTEQVAAEQALAESEQRFRTMADNISQLAWMTDANGWIFWYNRRWYDYTGTTLEQMEGWGWKKVHHPDHVDRVVEKISRCFQTGEPWEDEFPLRRHDGEYRWFLSRAVPIRDAQGRVVRWFGTNTDVTERRQAEEALRKTRDELEHRVAERTVELQHRADQLAHLTSELTLAEQRERHRLAKILHDHLQQLLVGAKFGVDMLKRRVSGELKENVRQLDDLLDESIKASRSLTVELSPPILHEGGLAAGLEWLARWMEEKHGLKVDFRSDHRAATEREDVRVLLFESARELLLNVVKHAGVSHAAVELTVHNQRHLRLTVADRGRGFDATGGCTRAQPVHGGFGLFSIRERLGMLGGRLEIESRPGEGARFTLIAPMGFETTGSSLDGVDKVEPGEEASETGTARPPVEPGGPIRLMVVDDHRVMRQGLLLLLAEEEDMKVVGEASDGLEALEQARRLHPDLVLMDFSMPEMDGVQATRKLRAEMPHVQVIGLSMYEQQDRAAAMMEAGAAGYLTKSGSADVLLETIRTIHRAAGTDAEER